MLFWIFLPNGKLRVKNVGIEAMVDFLVSRFFWSVGLLIRRFNPPKDVESSKVSLLMIFEALQSEIFRFKFHSLGLKILKIPEFNLYMKVPNIWAMLYGPYYDISSSHLRIISINLSYRGIIRS